jgi:hypothetical protein
MELAAGPSPHIRHCPLCAAVCPGRATICYRCKKPFPARMEARALEPGEVEAAVAQIRAEAHEAGAAPDLKAQPGKLGAATYVCAVLVLAAAAFAFVSVEGAIVLGVILAIPLLVALIADLVAPGARGRADATRAIRCYVAALRRGRWKTAHACLSPQARRREVRVPLIESLKTKQAEVVMATPKDVKSYWRTIVRPSGGTIRRIAKVQLTPLVTDGDVHRHRVTLDIQSYPAWVNLFILAGILPALVLIALSTKTTTHHMELATYRWRSQWVLVSGEFASPVDQALPLPLSIQA